MLDRPETTLWTPHAVRDAMAEAFRVLSATEGRVGHRRVRAAWPDYAHEWEDLIAQQEHKTFKRTRQPRFIPSSHQIAHMEIVLLGKGDMPAWPNGPLKGYRNARNALIASSMARAIGYSERQVCEAKGWALTTHRRHRDKGAVFVANWLNRQGVRTW